MRQKDERLGWFEVLGEPHKRWPLVCERRAVLVISPMCRLVFVLLLTFGVALNAQSASGQSRSPQDYCNTALGIREVAAYMQGGQAEIYIIFTNPQTPQPTFRGMVAAQGDLTVNLPGVTVMTRRSISCGDFSFFVRGIQQETVLAYVLPPVVPRGRGTQTLSIEFRQAQQRALTSRTTLYVP